MRYISVCSGIEAATVAWHPLGWQAAAYSEIEPFPSAVLAHHYPDVPNVGDMTKFKEWNIERGTVDLLVGGTPCQSFSVAGLRKGLADPRGNLALVYCGILDHFKPKWFVWENVPGVLSSGGGRDFGSFLGAVAELGYGFAYRVLDAQYFGVAQRRRRVFVVGHLGDWRPAAKVLFERESLRGDPAPSREKGKAVAPTVTGGAPFSRTGNERVEVDAVSMCLNAGAEGGVGFWNIGPDSVARPDAVTATLDTRSVDGPRRNQGGPIITQPYPIANTLTARMHKGINSTVDEGQTPVVTHSLRGEGFDASENGTGRGTPLVAVGFDSYNHAVTGDVSKTLDVGQDYHHVPNVFQPVAFHPTQDPISSTEVCHSIGANENATAAVAQPINIYGGNKRADRPEGGFYVRMDEDTSKTLDAASGLNPTCSQGGTAVMQTMQVRRLTPTECERLQGFPDNYTAIPWRKKPIEDCPDGPRYKALGNSMAVPVMAWIGKRIANAA